MGQDPGEIREEIERTRAEMGQTVDAIGYKADVPARARDRVSETVDNVRAKVSGAATRTRGKVVGATSQAGGRVSDAAPSRAQVKRTARRAVGLARQNPLGLAVGAVAVGFLAGLTAPATPFEERRLGRVTDQVKQTGQEALQRGKDVVQQAARSAVDTANEQGQQHGQAVARHARERAQDIRP